jgi:hypothetical protein
VVKIQIVSNWTWLPELSEYFVEQTKFQIVAGLAH